MENKDLVELEYVEDWKKYISEEELSRRNDLIETLDNTLFLSVSEQEELLTLERKIRKCSSCKKVLSKCGLLGIVTIKNKQNKTIQIGYMRQCFSCELKEILYLGDNGLL